MTPAESQQSQSAPSGKQKGHYDLTKDCDYGHYVESSAKQPEPPCPHCKHEAHRPGLCEFGLADGECPCDVEPELAGAREHILDECVNGRMVGHSTTDCPACNTARNFIDDYDKPLRIRDSVHLLQICEFAEAYAKHVSLREQLDEEVKEAYRRGFEEGRTCL